MAPRIYTLTSWNSDTLNEERFGEHGENRVMVAGDDGNLWSSLNTDGGHTPVLDLDLPARLIPSWTAGHFHLVIDGVSMSWDQYERFLTICAEVGIISKKYLAHCLQRKMSMIRKAGVPKLYTGPHFSSEDSDPDTGVDFRAEIHDDSVVSE